MNNKKGFTLVEVMIAAGILGGILYWFSGGTSFLSTRNKQLEELMIMERHVNSLYENIQSNIDVYQITYDPKEFNSNTDPTNLNKYLPLAWDMKILTNVNNCMQCPGRMGYVIVPLDGYRGLYKLTIRATHPKVLLFKDYNFLINGK
jgi:prepilin-type N-terminal cleavage/methylation domain-containing protein